MMFGLIVAFGLKNRKIANDGLAPEVIRELHTDVLYLNVPIPESSLAQRIGHPLVPDVFNGSAWVSVVIDYATFELNIPMLGFVKVPMEGYQHKVNFLVKDTTNNVSGYLIARIEFEKGIFGFAKSIGAILTQGVPSTVNRYNVLKEKNESGSVYSWQGSIGDNNKHIRINTTVESLEKEHTSFYQFVTDRPFKYAIGDIYRNSQIL